MMKALFYIGLTACLFLPSGCVNRTVTEQAAYRGSGPSRKYGSKNKGEVIEEKRVWIWQDEFRNPK